MEGDSKKEDKYHSAFGYLRSYVLIAILTPIVLFVIHDVVQIICGKPLLPIGDASSIADIASLALTAVIGVATIGIAVIGILLIFFGFTARQDIKDRFEIYSRDVETLKKEMENVKQEIKEAARKEKEQLKEELKEESQNELDKLREQLKSETKQLKEEIDVHSVERLRDTATEHLETVRKGNETLYFCSVLSDCSQMLNILSRLENPFENKKLVLLEFGLTIAEGAISELPDTYIELQTPHSIISILNYSKAFLQFVSRKRTKDQSQNLKEKAESLTDKILKKLQPLKPFRDDIKDIIRDIIGSLETIVAEPILDSPEIRQKLSDFKTQN